MDQSTAMVPSFSISPKAERNFWKCTDIHAHLQFCCCYGDADWGFQVFQVQMSYL